MVIGGLLMYAVEDRNVSKIAWNLHAQGKFSESY